ncbi:MAG: polyphosphate polymerase domain-containing protein [Bacteroidales bacterium]|nr:polyphosphate polymerase domain-containing protein [Bacteroidales bacterium]
MESIITKLSSLLDAMPPITLEEMSSIRLMNRTDTKFVTNLSTLYRLLDMARDDYYAQEVCGKRISPYRTTYWDGEERHEMYRTHVTGHATRMKVRVRTYVDSGVTFLEVKKKDNHGQTRKIRTSVPSLDAVIKERAGEAFLEDHTGYSFGEITPTLGNEFNRITLVNRGKTERLTIDFALNFYNYETGREAGMQDAVIIELKRDGRVSSPILAILRALRVKPAGFSKYCVGVSITNEDLRQNRFKPRLHKIDKIIHKQQAMP